MADFNWWRNRATWLVWIHYNPETHWDLDYIKETLEDAVEDIENPFLKDLIDLKEIDWDELETHFD